MEIVKRKQSMQELMRRERRAKRKVGFVPTMGFLHEGHLSLIRRVRQIADTVVVSIFVNPTQFGEGEDFESYPRDLTRDTDLCVSEGVDYLFVPETKQIYPDGHSTYVVVEELSKRFEGKSRPGHFRGVATVVTKLLNIVRPSVAAFGQKDLQQSIVIRRMVRDLMMETEILVLPIVRDANDIALSSRNKYLSPAQLKAAQAIPRALQAAEHVVQEGQRRPEEVVLAAREVIEAERLLKVDYVELVDMSTMKPVPQVESEQALVVAVYAGETRLLDNTIIRV